MTSSRRASPASALAIAGLAATTLLVFGGGQAIAQLQGRPEVGTRLCTTTGGNCSVASSGPVMTLISRTSSDKGTPIGIVKYTQGFDFPCDYQFGDPSQGDKKTCLGEAALTPFKLDDKSWIPCGDDSSYNCDLQGATLPVSIGGQKTTARFGDGTVYTFVRYGAPGRWTYFPIQQRISGSTFVNGNSKLWVGVNGETGDPTPGVGKKLQIMNGLLPLSAKLTRCASAGQPCSLAATGLNLIVAGDDKAGYWSRLVFNPAAGSAFNCDSFLMGQPNYYDKRVGIRFSPPGEGTCYAAPIPDVQVINGNWQIVKEALGGVSEISYRETWGVEKGLTHENSSEWSLEVSTAIEASQGVEGVAGSKQTVTATAGYRSGTSIAESFVQNKGGEFEVKCGSAEDKPKAVYQWKTSVDNWCPPGKKGSCTDTAASKSIFCMTAKHPTLPSSPLSIKVDN